MNRIVEDCGVCETCAVAIEKCMGIWQHTDTKLIRCQGLDGHAYPNRHICETPGCYDQQPHTICEM